MKRKQKKSVITQTLKEKKTITKLLTEINKEKLKKTITIQQ